MIENTMAIIAEALSHFDPSVSGAVKYSVEPVQGRTVDYFWKQRLAQQAYYLTEKGKYSRYGEDPQFSPEWLEHLSVEDHEGIASFIRKHRESYWAIDGLFVALSHQCLSSNPKYSYFLRNFLMLWDSTTSVIQGRESEDCYSLHAISGLGGVDISSLPVADQERYRALAGFAVDTYLNDFFGRGHGPHPSGKPFAVDEIVFPGDYIVQEPYRSMVLQYPEQAVSMIQYMHRGYTGDELAALLAESTPAVMSTGVL